MKLKIARTPILNLIIVLFYAMNKSEMTSIKTYIYSKLENLNIEIRSQHKLINVLNVLIKYNEWLFITLNTFTSLSC